MLLWSRESETRSELSLWEEFPVSKGFGDSAALPMTLVSAVKNPRIPLGVFEDEEEAGGEKSESAGGSSDGRDFWLLCRKD